MKVCVIGDGLYASGLAGRLAQTEAELSLILPEAHDAPHLEAIQDNGLTLVEGDGYVNLDLIASDTTAFLGPQDVVILLPAEQAIERDVLKPLIGDTTMVLETAPAEASHGSLAVRFDLEFEPLAPGVVRHVAGNAIIFDESRARQPAFKALLERAGIALGTP